MKRIFLLTIQIIISIISPFLAVYVIYLALTVNELKNVFALIGVFLILYKLGLKMGLLDKWFDVKTQPILQKRPQQVS